MLEPISPSLNVKLIQILMGPSQCTQCAPAFSNPDQKVHGLSHFYIVVMYKTIKNQFKKHLLLGFQNLLINMAENCH